MNIAYYRAAWREGEFVARNDFYKRATGNFLDIAVLEWCKLFVDYRGKHHWLKVVIDKEKFCDAFLKAIKTTEREYHDYQELVQTYRDKFVAHLDNHETMHIPVLDVMLSSTVFLYEQIKNDYGEWLQGTPSDLNVFYEEGLSLAAKSY
jgi:hypothetical protein